MRTLSLVDCIELKLPGSIMKEALCFGDVDGDGILELVVGNSDGDLFIFKDNKCICRAFDLGAISAVAVGDLLNINKNITLVVTTEGYCHVFDVEDELTNTNSQPEFTCKFDPSGSIASVESFQPADCRIIQQFHSQRIVANIKAIFLADVNDDGETELVCGLTDRVLRTYKWSVESESVTEAENLNVNNDPVAAAASLSADLQKIYDGKVQAVNKWELANQIGSIAPHQQGNLTSILIGTGGGTVTRITEISEFSRRKSEEISINQGQAGAGLEKELPPGVDLSILRYPNAITSENISIKHHTLNSSRMRNQNISTHVAGNIASFDGKNEDSYAVGTWDGTVMICKDDTIEWSFQVDKPVMTVQSYSGNAIFVDWEGPTYLINRRIDPLIQNCVFRFYFEDQVAGFRVGSYGMRQNSCDDRSEIINQKCFAYVTFNGSIFIYPNSFL